MRYNLLRLSLLFLSMLKKIYFGNKPLIIAEKITEDLKTYVDGPTTMILNTNNKSQLQLLIKKMEDISIDAGIVLGNVNEVLEQIKNEFTLVPASGGIVYNGDKILFIYRRGKWDLPKGKLDEGEDIVDCALREVSEETGLTKLVYQEFLCTSYHTYREGQKHILKESHWHLLTGDDAESLTPQTDEDIEKCEWVPVNNLAPYLENAPTSIIDVVEAGLKLLKKSSSN